MDDLMKNLHYLMMKSAAAPRSHPKYRREGFGGQKIIVLPNEVIGSMDKHPLLSGLYPTATGFYPEAPGHFVERERGVPEAILIVCLSGAGWVDCGEKLAVRADEALLIPPGLPHSYGADDALPWSIRWAHFRGGEVAEFLKLFQATNDVQVLGLPRSAHQAMDMEGIYYELEHGYSFANLLTASARLRTAMGVLHQFRHVEQQKNQLNSGEAVQMSLEWMTRHIHRRPILKELASQAGMSVPHFSAMFRERTGYAPVDYFLRLKIHHAGQMLDTTGMRVSEIAVAVGFEDPYYFSRLFRKFTGHAPRDYRNVPKA